CRARWPLGPVASQRRHGSIGGLHNVVDDAATNRRWCEFSTAPVGKRVRGRRLAAFSTERRADARVWTLAAAGPCSVYRIESPESKSKVVRARRLAGLLPTCRSAAFTPLHRSELHRATDSSMHAWILKRPEGRAPGGSWQMRPAAGDFGL